jgi:hypothetical protein
MRQMRAGRGEREAVGVMKGEFREERQKMFL